MPDTHLMRAGQAPKRHPGGSRPGHPGDSLGGALGRLLAEGPQGPRLGCDSSWPRRARELGADSVIGRSVGRASSRPFSMARQISGKRAAPHQRGAPSADDGPPVSSGLAPMVRIRVTPQTAGPDLTQTGGPKSWGWPNGVCRPRPPAEQQKAKHTTAGIRTWSPTVLLVRRFAA